MDDFKSEKWTLDDGRRAERRVVDSVLPSGEGERVIELHVEDERPLRLSQRVVEKRKPFVYEREIQTVDKSGNVVDKKVESVEPRVQMQLVEHIAQVPNLHAMAETEAAGNDCHVTKEEMIETIVTAVKALKESATPAPVPTTPSVGQAISQRQEAPAGMTLWDKLMWGAIIVLTAAIGYVAIGL